MKPQFVVFSTSGIFQYQVNWPGGRVVYDNRDECPDRPTVLVSTGKLEAAIEQGFTPLVATTRTSLGSHDQWWVDIVEKAGGKVFVSETSGCIQECSGPGSAWRKLYDFLGEEWPKNEGGEDEYWTAAEHLLRKKYKNQYDFVTNR